MWKQIIFFNRNMKKWKWLLPLVSDGFVYVFSVSINTPDRWQSKTLMILTKVDQRSLATLFDWHLTPNWQQMAIENTVFCDLWSAFINCSEHFPLPVRCDKRAYFYDNWNSLVISPHLNMQTMSLSGLKWQWSPLLPCFDGNEAHGQWLVTNQPHCYTLNWDQMYNCQQLKHVNIL